MGVYDDRQRNRFMLRIRIPGGQINADQLDTVAGVIRDFGNGWQDHVEPDRFGEITTRQDIQVHWVEFTQLPEIWRRFDAVGMTSAQACGDSMRNPTACPADGADPRGYLPVATAHRGVPHVLEGRGEADRVPAAQVEGRRHRLPDRLRGREAPLPRVHAGACRRRHARVQRPRGRRAERLAADRRRARPVRAPRPGDRHRPGHAADLPRVRRLRHEGGQPVPGARAPARTGQGDRRDPRAGRERDDRRRRVVVDRRAGGPPRRAPRHERHALRRPVHPDGTPDRRRMVRGRAPGAHPRRRRRPDVAAPEPAAHRDPRRRRAARRRLRADLHARARPVRAGDRRVHERAVLQVRDRRHEDERAQARRAPAGDAAGRGPRPARRAASST